MDVYLLLIAIPVAIGALVVALALLNPSGVTIDDLLRGSNPAWSRGVQEEEPVHWRIEKLAVLRPSRSRSG